MKNQNSLAIPLAGILIAVLYGHKASYSAPTPESRCASSTGAFALLCVPETTSLERLPSVPPGGITFAWTIRAAPSWLAPFEGRDLPEYRRYLDWAQSHGVDLDPRALLRRQRAVWAKEKVPVDDFDWVLQAADTGKVRVGPVNRLQALLFMFHIQAPGSQAQEFSASVLKEGSEYRVYFHEDAPGSCSGTCLSLTIEESVDRDLLGGWSLLADLHNHPFKFGRVDINGTTIPSEADREHYLNLKATRKLEWAWITNGLDVIELPAAEFENFPNVKF